MEITKSKWYIMRRHAERQLIFAGRSELEAAILAPKVLVRDGYILKREEAKK